MKERIIEIIAQIIKKDEADLVLDIGKEGRWDSLKLVEIVFALEDEFDVMFNEEEIANMKSISKIYEYISRKVER